MQKDLSVKRFGKIAGLLCILASALFCAPDANAQRIALKTNALEYAILSPNLALEARLNKKLSLQVAVATCPINKPIGSVQFANFRVEPELRYWFNRPMAKHFIALSATAGSYSLRHKDRHFTGDMVAAGISYGYALVLSKHWNMEAEIGIGIGSFKGYDYEGVENKPDTKNYDRILPVPIRLALTFGYVF